jgi:hypothetical protein
VLVTLCFCFVVVVDGDDGARLDCSTMIRKLLLAMNLLNTTLLHPKRDDDYHNIIKNDSLQALRHWMPIVDDG